MGCSEESSSRKPTADLSGGPAVFRGGDPISGSGFEFRRCATDSADPLLCIMASIEPRVCRLCPYGPRGRSTGNLPTHSGGFTGLSPSGGSPKIQGEYPRSHDAEIPLSILREKPGENVREGWNFWHHGDQFRTRPRMKLEAGKGTKSPAIHAFQKRLALVPPLLPLNGVMKKDWRATIVRFGLVGRLGLALLLLLVSAAPATAAINLVTHAKASGPNVGAASPWYLQVDVNTPGNSTVVVAVAVKNTAVTPGSVTDSGGSLYGLLADQIVNVSYARVTLSSPGNLWESDVAGSPVTLGGALLDNTSAIPASVSNTLNISPTAQYTAMAAVELRTAPGITLLGTVANALTNNVCTMSGIPAAG